MLGLGLKSIKSLLLYKASNWKSIGILSRLRSSGIARDVRFRNSSIPFTALLWLCRSKRCTTVILSKKAQLAFREQ